MTDAYPWQTPMPGVRIVRRGAHPIRRIQLYGQRCSGTHVARALMEANFGDGVMTEQFGFKHWFVPRQMLFHPDTLVLVVAREAGDWVSSLHRQPWHAHPSLKQMAFGDFIRAEWHSYWDEQCYGIAEDHPVLGTKMMHERCPDTGTRFANCLAKRTAKLAQWSALPGRAHHVALVGYHALRDAPAAVVAAIAEATGLARIGAFVGEATYKGHGIKPFVATDYPALAPADADHLAAWLDPRVEALFDLPAAAAAFTAPPFSARA